MYTDEELAKITPEQWALIESTPIASRNAKPAAVSGADAFVQGTQRGTLRTVAGMPGLIAGAKAGAALPIPHPVGKAAAAVVGGLMGYTGTSTAGDMAADALGIARREGLPQDAQSAAAAGEFLAESFGTGFGAVATRSPCE